MTDKLEQMAPGCFGAASVFSMDSTVCKACVAYSKCSDASIATLESIRQTIDVRDLMARHTAARQRNADKLTPPAAAAPVQGSPIPVAQPPKVTKPVVRKTTMARVSFDISPADQNVIAMIGEKSVKTRDQAIQLSKQNKINQCRSELPKGVNPFAESGPAFLRVACDMLINGGFTKASLKARLREDMTWTDGTAGSHVAITCALMYAFGIITPEGDRFILNPQLG